MSSPRIALFSSKDCAQVAALGEILLEQGAIPLVFDMRLGGGSAPSFTMGGDRFVWGGVDFSDIGAIHVRCRVLGTPVTVPAVMNAASYCEMRGLFLREQEYQSAVHSFLDRLAQNGKLVVNLLSGAYIDHDSKAQLYQKLGSQGYTVPRSLMTNDPQRALAFINEVGEAVAKPSIGAGSTRKITHADLERLDELRPCPVLMQEFFAGDTIRVHIVGNSVVLALRIISDGQIDSRTTPKGFEYFRLPEAEEQRIVEANRGLGLHYAAWDILATGDGRYVYLDCNSGPYIMWIGPEYARVVLGRLAGYLLAYARTQSIAEASRQVQPYRP